MITSLSYGIAVDVGRIDLAKESHNPAIFAVCSAVSGHPDLAYTGGDNY
jgi:hypothetical protein